MRPAPQETGATSEVRMPPSDCQPVHTLPVRLRYQRPRSRPRAKTCSAFAVCDTAAGAEVRMPPREDQQDHEPGKSATNKSGTSRPGANRRIRPGADETAADAEG